MSLDLSDISVSGVSVSSIVDEVGLYTYYQTGVNGYCYGNSSSSIEGCETPTTPFWFNLESILTNTTVGSKILADLPSEVSEYETALKAASYTMWGCFIAVMCISALMFILGTLSMCAPMIGCCVSMLGSLNFLLALVAAGVATGMFKIYSSKFNDAVSTFGVKASVGASGLAVAWCTAGAALLTNILFVLTSCCGVSRTRAVPAAPMVYDTGYVPVHNPDVNDFNYRQKESYHYGR